MKKFAFVLALSMILAGAALAELEIMQLGPGGQPAGIDRSVVWLDEPDEAGTIGSSEIIGEFGLESEMANDFLIEAETTICLVTWWGGYYNGDPLSAPGFNLRFYLDAGCIPGDMILEVVVTGDAGETPFVEPNVFVYSSAVDLLLTPNLYWFSAQLADHVFPPQWGRLAAVSVQICDTVFKSAYFAFPDWIPFGELIGAPYDASQMFEDDCGVATETSSWGAIKGLYR